MRSLIFTTSLFTLLFAGCSTPASVKKVQDTLIAETPKFKDAHLEDLKYTESYINQTKATLDSWAAELNLRAINIKEATDAWRAARAASYRAQILEGFDSGAFKAINQCLGDKAKEFDERINVTLRPLVEDQLRKQKAYQANSTSVSLRDDYELAALKTALLHDSSNAVFLKQFKELCDGLFAARIKLEKDIDEQFAASKIGFGATKPGESVVFTKALSADQQKSTYDPALSIKRIAERRELVMKSNEAIQTDLKALKYYLDTDGYSRIFVKDAVGGAIEAVRSSISSPIASFLTDDLKLPADLAKSFTGKALDGLGDAAADSLFGIFTSLQKKAAAAPDDLLKSFDNQLKARETELLAKTLKT